MLLYLGGVKHHYNYGTESRSWSEDTIIMGLLIGIHLMDPEYPCQVRPIKIRNLE